MAKKKEALLLVIRMRVGIHAKCADLAVKPE